MASVPDQSASAFDPRAKVSATPISDAEHVPTADSCGIPHIDLIRQTSFEDVELEISENGPMQIQLWSTMIASIDKLPNLENSTWATWSNAFYRLVMASNSAYLFFPSGICDAIVRSHIHKARTRWMCQVLIKCTPAHPTREIFILLLSFSNGSRLATTPDPSAKRRLSSVSFALFASKTTRNSPNSTLGCPDLPNASTTMSLLLALKPGSINYSKPRPFTRCLIINRESSLKSGFREIDSSFEQLLQKATWKAVNLPTAPVIPAARLTPVPLTASKLRCTHCKLRGHDVKNCRKKAAEMPKETKKGKAGGGAGKGKSPAGTINSVPTRR